MRRSYMLAGWILALLPLAASAMTADELIQKNIEARGGLAALQAVKSVVLTGKFRGGGGFEADFVQKTARPGLTRTEFSLQGMTQIQAYDGKDAWQISPFGGRKDPDKLPDDLKKVFQVQADVDGPLIDYATKGNKVEYLGTEDVDGTLAHKLKVTLATGNEITYFFDPDFFLEIRTQSKTFVRGTEQESETDLGDYEKINGVYFPMAIDSGAKGSSSDEKGKVEVTKVEVNTELDPAQFAFPETKAKP